MHTFSLATIFIKDPSSVHSLNIYSVASRGPYTALEQSLSSFSGGGESSLSLLHFKTSTRSYNRCIPVSLIIISSINLKFLCVWVLCPHVCCIPYACLVPSETREGTGPPGTVVTNSCKLLYGCWELIPDPLEDQPAFLTIECLLQPRLHSLSLYSSEPSLLLPRHAFFILVFDIITPPLLQAAGPFHYTP